MHRIWTVLIACGLLAVPMVWAQDDGSGSDGAGDGDTDARPDADGNQTAPSEDDRDFERRDGRLTECKQQRGPARDECLAAYCEDPAPDRVDDCQRWKDQTDRDGDRQAASETFTACRAASDDADDRRSCADDHNEAVRQDDAEARAEREARIAAAKDARQVGAVITLQKPADGLDDGQHVESIDVEASVETVGARAGADAADVRITVSADLVDGRTIVLDVDPALLSGPDLLIRYFDVNDDGTETEVLIRPADDLLDALDASDDAGQPEYWVVSDADGLHILASVPHWSVHAITIQGLGEFVSEPSVVTGIVAGVLGSVGAAAVMFWPRRRQDA